MHLKNAMKEPSALTEEEWVAYLMPSSRTSSSSLWTRKLSPCISSSNPYAMPFLQRSYASGWRANWNGSARDPTRLNKTAMPLVAGDIYSAQQEHTICGKKRSTEVRDDRTRCADLRSAPVPPRLCRNQKSPHWTSLWPRSIPPDDAYTSQHLWSRALMHLASDLLRHLRSLQLRATELASFVASAWLFKREPVPPQRQLWIAQRVRWSCETRFFATWSCRYSEWTRIAWRSCRSRFAWRCGTIQVKAAWNWKNYFQYMRHPRAYGTAAHTGAFSESKEIAVVIYENGKNWQRTTATTQSCCSKPACTMTCCFCAAWDARRASECRQMKGKRHCSMGIKDHERLAAPLPPTHWGGGETEDRTISLYINIIFIYIYIMRGPQDS